MLIQGNDAARAAIGPKIYESIIDVDNTIGVAFLEIFIFIN